MTIKELKCYLDLFEEDTELFIANSYNAGGSISELSQLEKSTYGFFGISLPCLVLNSCNNLLRLNEGDYPKVIETSGNKSDNNAISKIIVR